MANEVSIYEPRHLIEVVRTTPPIRTFLRDRFFSNVKTFPTRRVDIDIVKGNRKMAAFIHPLVGGEIVQSEGYETKSYAPPLINPATISTADQYMERLPGEDLFSGRTPADRAAEKLIEEYTYTNKQKKININVKVGTDERQLKLTGKVSSEADAKARLIAAIKNANHGATQISFTMLGYPAGASAQCFNLVGYGKMDGKYFVDQMEHSISPSSGYKTQVKASKVEKEDFA